MNKMKKLLCLTLLLLMLPTLAAAANWPDDLTAIDEEAFMGVPAVSGVVAIPDGVASIGARAFADTDAHALVLPATVATVGDDVLGGAPAAYVWLNGFTSMQGTPGSAYVFGPTGHYLASSLSNYVSTDKLVEHEGFYYFTSSSYVQLLCAVSSGMTGTVRVPKLVGDQIVHGVFDTAAIGTEQATFLVPEYISERVEVPHQTYKSMQATLTLPEKANPDWPAQMTAEQQGAYKSVTCEWVLTPPDGSAPITRTTTDMTLKETLPIQGEWQITVTVIDSVGDSASANGVIPVSSDLGESRYRAYIVGNTYPGTGNYLPGPDKDAQAVNLVLGRMHGTPYDTTVALNVTENQMYSGIRSAFSAADGNDVSLFYFSGHGAELSWLGKTCLVGLNDTLIYPEELRAVLDEIPGTKLVLLDACHSGGMIGMGAGGDAEPMAVTDDMLTSFVGSFVRTFRQGDQLMADDDLAAPGYQVIVACRSDQTSASIGNVGTEDYWGAFTYGLLYGSGYDIWYRVDVPGLLADKNGDGKITLLECYNDIVKHVNYLDSVMPFEVDQVTRMYGDNGFVMWAQ